MRGLLLVSALLVAALAPGCLEDARGLEGGRGTFVLVRAVHDLNATDDRPVEGAFGPHCADAEYALDPPRVTLRTEDAAPAGVLVIDHRAWGSPNRGNASVLTTSADGVGARSFDPGNATLPFRSAYARNGSWEDRPVLATLTFHDGEAHVGGVPLPAGESLEVRRAFSWEEDGVRYDAVEILAFVHVGDARVETEKPGLCA